MKTKLLRYYLYFLFAGCVSALPGNTIQAQPKSINWGFTVGMNALSTTRHEVYNGDEILPTGTCTDKTGYLLNACVRINLNRIFLQPEIAWNYYRRNCAFSLPVKNSENQSVPVSFDINSSAVNTNFLLGYNVIYNTPFLFGVFIGLSYIGTYRTDYSEGMNTTFSDRNLSVNYTGILGFSINISKIRFDLRYELNQPNTDIHFNKIPDIPDNYHAIQIKKNENMLSFSCGMMF